jgi:cytokinin dehydrogenase
LWLTPEHEPELFQHVLCGLGQYGVITRAKLRLRPFRPYTQIVYLTYQSLAAFLHDALILMRRDHVHLLEGGALPELSGQPRRYLLEAATALEGPAEEAGPQLFQDLSGEAQAIVLNRPTPEYLFRLEQRFARYNRPGEQNCAHPWVEHFLPWAGVTEYVQAATTSFPSTALLLWPMQTDKLPWATFVLPKTAEVMLVGIMANIPQTQLEETLPLLRQVHALGLDLGGKRYLSGWVEFDPAQWREHYGPARWDRIQQLKQRCDPYNIFQPALHSSTGVS